MQEQEHRVVPLSSQLAMDLYNLWLYGVDPLFEWMLLLYAMVFRRETGPMRGFAVVQQLEHLRKIRSYWDRFAEAEQELLEFGLLERQAATFIVHVGKDMWAYRYLERAEPERLWSRLRREKGWGTGVPAGTPTAEELDVEEPEAQPQRQIRTPKLVDGEPRIPVVVTERGHAPKMVDMALLACQVVETCEHCGRYYDKSQHGEHPGVAGQCALCWWHSLLQTSIEHHTTLKVIHPVLEYELLVRPSEAEEWILRFPTEES
jgi:hypothetical protein